MPAQSAARPSNGLPPILDEAKRRRFEVLAVAVCQEFGAAPLSFKVGRFGTVLAAFRTRAAAVSAAAALSAVLTGKRIAPGADPIGPQPRDRKWPHRKVWRLAATIAA